MFSCRGNGVTRRPLSETYEIGCKDIQALSDALGDQKFLMGDHMTEVMYTNGAWTTVLSGAYTSMLSGAYTTMLSGAYTSVLSGAYTTVLSGAYTTV